MNFRRTASRWHQQTRLDEKEASFGDKRFVVRKTDKELTEPQFFNSLCVLLEYRLVNIHHGKTSGSLVRAKRENKARGTKCCALQTILTLLCLPPIFLAPLATL